MNDRDFQHPLNSYRSIPFWSWNGELEDEILLEQINAFHKGGQGGFFMHARVGLKTPYMSEAWLERVKTCVAEAERLGLEAWLYDEDNWPSGFAGGLVANQDERYRARALVCLVSDTASPVQEALLQVTGVLRGNQLKDLQPWRGEPLEKGRKLIQCYHWVAPLGRAFLKGSSYIDTLNPEAVGAFLQSTHERYKTHVGEAFGKTIPGIFTDEPSLGFGRAIPKELRSHTLPWTDELPEIFLRQHGYDVVPQLASLFFDTEDAPAIRHDFWSTVTKQFCKAWSQQLYDWCDANNLKLVGHHNGEDSLLEQMRWTGGVMPHYRYYHMPGIDKLGRNTGEVPTGSDVDGGIVGLKQLDSVACQTGKERTLCEAFGCTGQDFALEGRWWLTNWLAVLGINFFNPHLALYSLRGERKRDYPPTLSPHQPWWPYQQPYEAAAARLAYALSQGKRIVDVIVIHPVTSAWITYTPGSVSMVKELDRMLLRLANGLLAMHADYHFGDETLLAELGRVDDKTLKVGEQSYKVVIIPELKTLERSTVELLEQFANSGGIILCLGNAPLLIDGRRINKSVLPAQTLYLRNEVSNEAMAHLPNDPARAGQGYELPLPLPTLPQLRTTLEQVCPPRITIQGEGADRVWYHLRTLEDGRELLFLANTHEENKADISLVWRGTGKLEHWDIVSGKIKSQASEQTQTITQIRLELPPMNNVLLVRDAKSHDVTTPLMEKRSTLFTLKSDWTLERRSPNILVLDYCAYKLGNATWQDSEYVLHVANKIREEGRGSTFALRFEFEVDEIPSECSLAIESSKLQLELNGKPLPAPEGFWLDPSFQCYNIAELLQTRRNTLELHGTCDDDIELEAVYLLGDFALPALYTGEKVKSRALTFKRWRVQPRLQAVTQQTYYGDDDLVARGLPHFVGEVHLSQTFHLSELPTAPIFLELDTLHAAVAIIAINGQRIGQVSWQPLELDVTGVLQQGDNTITITLVTSLRNALGPFHTEGGDSLFVSPQTFLEHKTRDYWLVPLGLSNASLKLVVNSEIEKGG
jgi:hypothetical protein